MILVRDIFQLKFGKMKEAMEIWKQALSSLSKTGFVPDRMLTDLTGEYYTLIMESTHDSLAAFEETMKMEIGSDDWRRQYQKFIELVESGRREIFTVVPIKK
jgi:phage terminase large subunit-like protein